MMTMRNNTNRNTSMVSKMKLLNFVIAIQFTLTGVAASSCSPLCAQGNC